MKRPKKTQFGDYATWIRFEVFSSYAVRLILTDDLTKSAKARLGHMPADPAADGFVFHPNEIAQSYIFLPMNPSENVIAHEAWHIVHKVMDYVGAGIDSEVVAYQPGWLVGQIYRFKNSIQEAKNGHSRSGSKKRS